MTVASPLIPHADPPELSERHTPPAFRQLSALWKAEYERLLSFARSQVPAHYAEDLVQEAVMKLLDRLAKGTAPTDGALQASMLYALVRDLAAERHRQASRRLALSVFISGATAAMRRSVNAALPTQRREIVATIDTALATLPRRIADTFVLVNDHAITFEAAGALLGISAGAARSNYAKACARLRDALAPLGLEPHDLRGRFEQ